ncbi:cyclin-dependent kinase inhibitor 4-like, partial [Ananas comosus]|uniref:Cyclin-dependent kinase inhibitor 4-like n=1 Tax=Ananas comosus TaxID=4615 RepID=A0A6P5EA18_ANACO
TAAASVDDSSAYLELRSRRLQKNFPGPAAATAARAKRGPSLLKPSSHASPRAGSSPEVESKPSEPEVVGEGNSGAAEPVLVRSGVAVEEKSFESSPEIDAAIEGSFGDNVLDMESGRKTRESTPSSLIRDPATVRTPGSSTRPAKSTPRRSEPVTAAEKVIPSDQEIEDLFAKSEKLHQKDFAEKYNFDAANDKPLPGRYEWVKLDP